LTPPLRENPSEFLDETYTIKSRGMGLARDGARDGAKYGENCMLLASTVFD